MIKPYIVVPNLIEQSTWGGEYIVAHKNISHPLVKGKKIGQSYELYEGSTLSASISTSQKLFELGVPDNPNDAQVSDSREKTLKLSQLIEENPLEVLGSKSIEKYGQKMGLLIKFTQAKGNSYQLHVKTDTDVWQTKPESWYYFEPGIITLGVIENIDWQKYQKACMDIYQKSQELSAQVLNSKLGVREARKIMASYIDSKNISQYVNHIKVKKGDAIDLSACGVHHSWEEDDKNFPLGNVLYEVQKNSYDPKSTIRSFDKGKFNDDGSIRKLQIKDYFKYIDRSRVANDPKTYEITPKTRIQSDQIKITEIFQNSHYKMDELSLKESVSFEAGTNNETFHHIFVKSGKVSLVWQNQKITLDQGFGVFVPAICNQYVLTSLESSIVLKTYI